MVRYFVPVLTIALSSFAQSVLPVPVPQWFDSNGKPLSLGYVYTYSAGTTSPLATYTDSSGLVQNQNPVHLDGSGRGNIFLTPNSGYKLVVKTSASVTVTTIDGMNLASGSGFMPLTGSTVTGNFAVQGTTTLGSVVFGTGSCTGIPCLWTNSSNNVHLANDSHSVDSILFQNQAGSGDTSVTIKASSAQSGFPFQLKNATGTVKASINSAGGMVVGNLISDGGAVNARVDGATIGFQITNSNAATPVQIDGSGNVSAAGVLNLSGASSSLNIGGSVVINATKDATFRNVTITGTCTGSGCGGGGSSLPTSDANPLVYKAADITAQVRISAANVANGTAVVLTAPSASATLAGINLAQTWALGQVFTGSIQANGGIIGTAFNSTATGTDIAFQTSAPYNFQVDGDGNISGAGDLHMLGFVKAETALHLKALGSDPAVPASGFGGWSYNTGSIFRYYNVSTATWADIDLTAVGGGVTAVNGFTGAVTVQGSANEIIVTNGSNIAALSLPQPIATTSNVTFGSVIADGGAFNSHVNTSTMGFQVTNSGGATPYQVDGYGNVSAAGILQLNGSGNIFKIGVNTVLDSSRNLTVNNITIGGTCTGCAAAGVSSLNALSGVLSIVGTANQITVTPYGSTITLNTAQPIATTSNVTFGSVITGTNGAFNSGATGANIAFQTANYAFQVDGSGNISGAGIMNMTGGSSSYRMQGNTVIDAARNATVNNLTVLGTCTNCSAGVSSVNTHTGSITIQGTANQANVTTAGNTITISTPQNLDVNAGVHFGSVITAAGGAFNSGSTGSSIAFQTSNYNFQVDGNGNISAAGVLNMTGFSSSYKMVGNTVINTAGEFVGKGVNVCAGYAIPCPNGVGARGFNPYDSTGTVHFGRDWTIGINWSTHKLTVNGIDTTAITFVGGSLVEWVP